MFRNSLNKVHYILKSEIQTRTIFIKNTRNISICIRAALSLRVGSPVEIRGLERLAARVDIHTVNDTHVHSRRESLLAVKVAVECV
jgi:hypothetical protein